MNRLTIISLLLISTPLLAALPPDLFPPNAQLQKIIPDQKFTEGPVWVNDQTGGHLVFSDIPDSTIHKWTPAAGLSTLRHPSNQTNGNTVDAQRRLISCEHQTRRVVRTEPDGSITVLADAYDGHKLNSPNDVIVKSDGTIWFTDPPYGIDRSLIEQAHNYVFRLNPATGQVTPVASDFDMPNGLCFSPDEHTLYVADSGSPHHIRSFKIFADNTLGQSKTFATIDNGIPDGIRCDANGNLWSSAGDGIHIFSPEGSLLAKIPTPETPANLTFGGPDGHTLFITARSSVYSIQTLTTAANGGKP
ncbi:MAG TPA: SMP-30/gluconolactonase/LRE family protein [Tepidisphaeraceae bacterium]|jgi:gluconolactonase|nr:SMP-30/gluconolactonase/LRE family protein [Tepidisphaeraceae bacterium]